MFRKTSSLTAFGLIVASAAMVSPARANDQCLAQLTQQATQAGLATDSGGGNVAVWSSRRSAVAPLFASLSSCLKRAYGTVERRTQRGTRGSVYGNGACELPDLGLMGGHGEHRNDYAIWVHCSGGGTASAKTGGQLDCADVTQMAACARRALGTVTE